MEAFVGQQTVSHPRQLSAELIGALVIDHREHGATVAGEGARSFVAAGRASTMDDAEIGMRREAERFGDAVEAIAGRSDMQEQDEFHDGAPVVRRCSSQ